METIKAKGINTKGETIIFVVNGRLDCSFNNLTHLEVPMGVRHLDCTGNKLTHLEVPSSVTHLYCSDNNLTHLDVPSSVTYLNCSDNSFSGPNYFVNPKTNRVVIKQGDLFHCGCFKGNKEELLDICLEKGFAEIIEYFGLK